MHLSATHYIKTTNRTTNIFEAISKYEKTLKIFFFIESKLIYAQAKILKSKLRDIMSRSVNKYGDLYLVFVYS